MNSGFHAYGLRILIAQPLRLALTVSGIALCVILILFILGVYNGVGEGSVEYIRRCDADVWVLQANSTNLIRGTSLLPAAWADEIHRDSDVASATPVLLLLSTVTSRNTNATVLLTGYVPGAAGGPPGISEGRTISADSEIVLDRAFARKHEIAVGQHVRIRDASLKVVGLSEGTNAFVTQYAFVSLRFEQSMIDMPGLASAFILRARAGHSADGIKNRMENIFRRRVSAYTHDTFMENNIREMEAGILPMFYSIAAIGGVVLAIILSLILSVNILERRRDFAIMKILGAPKIFLDGLIIVLALTLALVSDFIGIALYFPLASFIETVSPEVATRIRPEYILYTTCIGVVASLVSALFSCRRIRKIYPLEVFS